jgi:hypothetical protein
LTQAASSASTSRPVPSASTREADQPADVLALPDTIEVAGGAVGVVVEEVGELLEVTHLARIGGGVPAVAVLVQAGAVVPAGGGDGGERFGAVQDADG